MFKVLIYSLLLTSFIHASTIKSFNGKITLDVDNNGTANAIFNANGLGINISSSNDIDHALEVSGNSLFSGNVSIDNALILNELSSSPTHLAGKGLLYTKTDNNLYYKDETGTETNLLSGGGSSFTNITMAGYLEHEGDTNTKFEFSSNDVIKLISNAKTALQITGNDVQINPGEQNITLTVKGGSTDSLLVCNAGSDRVGINTPNPDTELHVEGDATKPGGGSWSSPSDIRIKEDISEIDHALDKIMSLNMIKYRYKKNWRMQSGQNDILHYGMSAQNLEKVFPNSVRLTPNRIVGDDIYERVDDTKLITHPVTGKKKRVKLKLRHSIYKDELVKLINTSDVEMVHIKATQEQQALIEKLQKRILELEKRLTQLEGKPNIN